MRSYIYNQIQTKTMVKNKTHLFLIALLTLSVLTLPVRMVAVAIKSPHVRTLNAWWPNEGARVSGTVAFKGAVTDMDVSQYAMYWFVDNGAWSVMNSDYTDYPHKEAAVNVDSWTWKGEGPYAVTYVAQNRQGQEIARTSYSLYILSDQTAASTDTSVLAVESLAAPTTDSSAAAESQSVSLESSSGGASNPLSGMQFYVDPNSSAKGRVDAIANQPTARWFGGWNSDIRADANNLVTNAHAQGRVPTLVAYNIPQRDCGSYSAGGANSDGGYRSWIGGFAAGIGQRKAVVILEPDAVSGLDCLSPTDQATRLSLLNEAVSTLKSQTQAVIYIDAGNARWHPATVMADRLSRAGLGAADGFSLNVSNFITSNENIAFGNTLSNLVGDKHYVIDTSRNGNGPTADSQWCNPRGRKLGAAPTASTGHALVDAYLWIKMPGESDGSCNGGPSAGVWWQEYALELAKNSHLHTYFTQ